MERRGTRIKSIAVALDGTPLAASTIPFARELALSLSARVLVVSVIDGAVSDRFAEFSEAEDVSLVEAVRAYQAGLIRERRRGPDQKWTSPCPGRSPNRCRPELG